jgi:hypothetical protein
LKPKTCTKVTKAANTHASQGCDVDDNNVHAEASPCHVSSVDPLANRGAVEDLVGLRPSGDVVSKEQRDPLCLQYNGTPGQGRPANIHNAVPTSTQITPAHAAQRTHTMSLTELYI